MFIVDTHQIPSNRFPVIVSSLKKIVREELLNKVSTPETTPQLSQIDMAQTGSGFKGLQNKKKILDLHSNAKKNL